MNEMVERVARAVDPQAWLAIEDGRDALPDNLWSIRRVFATERARAVIEVIANELPNGISKQILINALKDSTP